MTNAQKFKDTFGFEPTLFVDCPIGMGGVECNTCPKKSESDCVMDNWWNAEYEKE